MPWFILLVCVCAGALSGTVYDALYIVRSLIFGTQSPKNGKAIFLFTLGCDVLFVAILALGFLYMSVLFGFGRFRWYMFVGIGIGFTAYFKSFHVLIAFLIKKVYNIITNKKSKGVRYDGRKKKSFSGGIHA